MGKYLSSAPTYLISFIPRENHVKMVEEVILLFYRKENKFWVLRNNLKFTLSESLSSDYNVNKEAFKIERQMSIWDQQE